MKLAIIGIFYDGYIDLWPDFLNLFWSNWPDCPYPLYIVNQEADLSFPHDERTKVLHAGKDAEYTKKVRCAIDNIDADYFLILLEDYFIGEKIGETVLSSSLDFIEKNHVKYLGFPLSLYSKDHRFGFKPKRIKPSDEYTIVSAYNIIEKSFLKRCVKDSNFNAWIYEGVYAKSKVVHTDEFLDGCFKNKFNTLHLFHGALQGKMLPHTLNHFKKKGYSFETKRYVLPRTKELLVFIKGKVKVIMPRFVVTFAKKVFRKKGVLDKYSEQISEEANKLGL